MTSSFVSIEQAIAELQQGRMLILMDDEHRENEGDLIIGAEYITPEAINFMAKYGRGLICLPMAEAHITRLRLPMMTDINRSPYQTAFTVSIEAANGVSTGISASDRAHTVRVAIDPASGPMDIISPGHIFPLRAHPGGVLHRRGQTEGSVDLLRLAGMQEAAVICEIINDDGTMSRRTELEQFSSQHGISLVSIQSLVEYRIRHEFLVREVAASRLPMRKHGEFDMKLFHNDLDQAEHFVLMTPSVPSVPIVRIHSECITGDVFGSCKCDCGAQLEESLALIAKEGGILIYLRQEGRGIGLKNKLKAYALQEQGYDTVDANVELGLPIDNRDYAVAYQMLKYLGVDEVRLLTNNPQKVSALTQYGIHVRERIPLWIEATPENHFYLKTKQQKLGHYVNITPSESL